MADMEDFASMLEDSLTEMSGFEGTVQKGVVISIDGDSALIDVGLKAEGRVPLKEFGVPGRPSELKVGDVVDIYVERLEDRNGEAMLSRDKARREEAWQILEDAFKENERVKGVIFGREIGRASCRERV